MTKRKYRIFSILLAVVLSAAGCHAAQNAEPVQETEPAQTAEPSQEAGAGRPDGSYVPASFQVQGGTGKVKITCPEVVLRQGRAEARIEFSSPNYEWVRADGVQYEPENAGEDDRRTSVFRIPVLLDEEMMISALTTAMSEPHEIEYTLLISVSEREIEAGDVKMDPFMKAIENNGRRLVNCPLLHTERGYEMDYESFEETIIREKEVFGDYHIFITDGTSKDNDITMTYHILQPKKQQEE